MNSLDAYLIGCAFLGASDRVRGEVADFLRATGSAYATGVAIELDRTTDRAPTFVEVARLMRRHTT